MKLKYKGWVKDGFITMPSAKFKAEVTANFEGDILLTVEKFKEPKTYEQIKAFHGPVVTQVQAYYMESEGLFKSHDRIKHELKETFLDPRKRYFSDGSPVIVNIPHPERKAVNYAWHLETVPSLSELTKEEFTEFLNHIIEHFQTVRGWQIDINSPTNSSHSDKES